MANVPRYAPQVLPTRDVPRRQIPRGVSSMFATDIAEVSADFAEMGRKMQEAQQVADYNRALNRTVLGLGEMSERYSQRSDYKVFPQEAEEEIKTFKEELLADIDDSETLELIGIKFDQLALLKLADIRGDARKMLVSEGVAASLAIRDTLEKRYAEASPQEKVIIQGMLEATDRGDIEAGIRTPEEVEIDKQARNANIARNEVWYDANTFGPEVALNKLQADQYDIPEERKWEFERELKREIKARKVKSDKALKDAQDRNFLKYYLMARNKQLKESEIMGLVQTQEIDSGDAVHLVKALDTYEDKTDPETYVKLRVGLSEGTVDEKDVIKNQGKLSTGDFERLYAKATTGEPESTHYKRSVRLFDLSRQNDVISAFEQVNLMNEFERRVKEENLKGEQITDLAKELIKPEKEDWVGNLFDSLWKKIKGEQITPKAKEEMIFAELPPASEHKDELFEDTATGKRYRSNGTEWIEEK